MAANIDMKQFTHWHETIYSLVGVPFELKHD